MWKILGGLLVSSFLLTQANAQTVSPQRSYEYDLISVSIQVNPDSTFDVEETQVFNFRGNYHKGYRDIPFRKIDAISDISVSDAETGQELIYSRGKLNKEEPRSWGKFTHYKEKGSQVIEWYYNLADTTYGWTLKYKVHGGLEFNRDLDRLYWNIFSNYDVPVKSAQVSVVLPGDFSLEGIPIFSYRNAQAPIITSVDGPISFFSSNFAPQESFTIDVSWPKGYVSQTAYWLDFVKIYYGYIFGGLIFLICLALGFIFWLSTEKLKKERGTIIPQYRPPKNLKPAVAEVLTKERITTKGLSATVIDLAVRGYLKIEEDKEMSWEKILVFGGSGAILFVSVVVLILAFLILRLPTGFVGWWILALIIILLLFYIGRAWRKKDYKVTKVKPYLVQPDVAEYEKKYLNLLFDGQDSFKTRNLKNRRELYSSIQEIKDDILKQAGLETKAYEVDLMTEKKKTTVWMVLFVVAVLIFSFAPGLFSSVGQAVVLVFSFLVSIVALFAFIKYEARLNLEGRILKEDWLGFKMYLEKAEKYRLQNLTPDLFEKYLPYAMIFGLEKKWAKAFESLHMSSPSWYGGAYYAGAGSSTSSGSSFSPSTFSASFASSFSSSFASSGGGGGGGGGGGAGGGGGGGGGGAS